MKSLARFFPAAALLLMPVGVSAQPVTVPKSFGVDDLQVVTLSHIAFAPQNSTQTYFSVCCVPESYRYPTSGFKTFFAPIDASLIPNGSRIEEINFFIEDSTAVVDANFGGYLCQSWTRLDGTDRNGDCPFSAASFGGPGDTVVTMTPNLTVEYESDADADGTDDSVRYVLAAQFGLNAVSEFSGDIRLRGARILFRRQVSPAPGAATFGDVPTDHPFFQFVEALASSGITAGCGSGNYCPDAPLTRGQMSVFLAKALGLHWPAP